jgi:biotin carboxyl carrier protein
VEKGQVLVLLESMKMQMQMRAPIAGRVSKVAVQRGAQVEKSTLLVQID